MFRYRLLLVLSLPLLAVYSQAAAQNTPAAEVPVDFGLESFTIPPVITINATPPRVVQLLIEALETKPIVQRRVELVHDLGLCRIPSAVPPVVAAMSDPHAAVRAEAARAAATLGDRRALPQLQKLLSDDDPAVRREAIRAGAMLGDTSFVAAGLKDPDESCFATACAYVSTTEHEAAIAARIPLLSPSARVPAIRTLGRRGARAYARLIAQELGTGDLPLMIASIQALQQMRAASELESVRKLLGHEHPTVRRAAVAAMSTLTSAEEQIAVARRMLADIDLSVRQSAVQLLPAHGAGECVPLLVEQLSASYPPLRDAAREALIAAAGEAMQTVIDATVELLADQEARRREDGSYVLGRIMSDAALERHMRLLRDQDWEVVRQAAESLGLIGRMEAAPELAKLATQGQSPDLHAAQAQAIASAFIACGRLRYSPVLPIVKPLISDKMDSSPAIRPSAIWAAGMVGDATDSDLAHQLLSVYKDNSPFEAEEARFEAMKAIGNMRYMPALEEIRSEAKNNPLPNLRWIAHRVGDRLAGTSTPYTPPTVPVVAETSIQDLPAPGRATPDR